MSDDKNRASSQSPDVVNATAGSLRGKFGWILGQKDTPNQDTPNKAQQQPVPEPKDTLPKNPKSAPAPAPVNPGTDASTSSSSRYTSTDGTTHNNANSNQANANNTNNITVNVSGGPTTAESPKPIETSTPPTEHPAVAMFRNMDTKGNKNGVLETKEVIAYARALGKEAQEQIGYRGSKNTATAQEIGLRIIYDTLNENGGWLHPEEIQTALQAHSPKYRLDAATQQFIKILAPIYDQEEEKGIPAVERQQKPGLIAHSPIDANREVVPGAPLGVEPPLATGGIVATNNTDRSGPTGRQGGRF